MSEEERRRYELEPEQAEAAREIDEADQELEFGEPRRDHSSTRAAVGDRDDMELPGEDEEQARDRARDRKSP
jgi:hypothetical protein